MSAARAEHIQCVPVRNPAPLVNTAAGRMPPPCLQTSVQGSALCGRGDCAAGTAATVCGAGAERSLLDGRAPTGRMLLDGREPAGHVLRT